MSKKNNYKIVSLHGGNSSNEINQQLSNLIVLLFGFRTNIKMFHWQTQSYAYHKISDELLSSVDDLTDKLVEAICGSYNIRPSISNNITINDVNNLKNLKHHVQFHTLTTSRNYFHHKVYLLKPCE